MIGVTPSVVDPRQCVSLASVGPDDHERVYALRFEKQTPRQPAGLEA